MAAKITGTQTALYVEDGYDFDQAGETYFITYRGKRSVILAKTAELKADGYRVSRRKFQGPVYQVTGTLSLAPESAGGGSAETPIDRWRIVTQLGQLDLRSNPNLIALAGDEKTLAKWVREIDVWIRDGADSGTYSGWSADKKKVADIRARGATSWEMRRPVLTRIRSISVNYASPFVMDAEPKVYTTGSLVSTFGIPLSVSGRLPATPTLTPANSTWAWMWTQQDSDTIPALGRVEEMDSWIFAPWSNSMYDVI